VELDGDLTARALDNLPSRVPPPSPADLDRRPRVGLVLGAGGVLGNAYLNGAVAALWEATGFEPRTSSVLIGTSAGSIHAALYGAGMPAVFGLWRTRGGVLPDADVVALGPWSHGPDLDRDLDREEELDMRDLFLPARALPRLGPSSKQLALRAALRPWAHPPEVALSAWLPEGWLTNAAVGVMLRRVVPSGWVPHPRTWVVASNVRTGERTVFGRPGAPRSHIDRAVRASCAIPALYRPVRIGRDRYVDGGLHSPSNADLARGLDLDLVVVISPLSSLEGHAASGLVDRYLAPWRRFAGRRLTSEIAALAADGVPTLCIGPTAADQAAFGRNLMDTRPRVHVSETAVRSVRGLLAAPDAADALALLRAAAVRDRDAAYPPTPADEDRAG